MSSASPKDLVLAPAVFASGLLFHWIRTHHLFDRPLIRRALRAAKVFPIVEHFYEPLPDFSRPYERSDRPRKLPAIDLRLDGQRTLLERLHFSEELRALLRSDDTLSVANGSFGPGDFEYLYSMIRHLRPRRLIEVGCGNSTRVAQAALARNRIEHPRHDCEHICVEPYGAPWLEQLDVRVFRQPVEDLPLEMFTELEAGDMLFIDSTHVIRPRGDVIFEFLSVIPSLAPGVVVHVHDIFTPNEYPEEWIARDVRLWNEQYLLEAFLSCNDQWEILGAVNHLKHACFDELSKVCPFLEQHHEPGSFYMRRRLAS